MEAYPFESRYPHTLAAYLKPFDESDWFGYAGASNFKDGSEPLMGYVDLNGQHYAVIVLGGEGGEVSIVGPDEDQAEGNSLTFSVTWGTLDYPTSRDTALAVLGAIKIDRFYYDANAFIVGTLDRLPCLVDVGFEQIM